MNTRIRLTHAILIALIAFGVGMGTQLYFFKRTAANETAQKDFMIEVLARDLTDCKSANNWELVN